MSRMEWNKPGERFFEAGVDRGALYPLLGMGVPWNGLVSVSERSVGGDLESLYYGGVKYADVISGENYQATLEAYSAPVEFAVSDGQKFLSPGLSVTQQPRRPFGLSYRTLIGNDLLATEYGYKIHLVYNCMASPADRNNQTLSNVVDPNTRTWQIDTVPPPATTFKPTAHIVIDSTTIGDNNLYAIESAIYGVDGQNPYLPTIGQLVAMLSP